MASLRTLARQRVICPTNSSLHVDIPIVDALPFGCAAEQFQEYQWSIKNSLNNETRVVHTHRVTNPQDSSQYVDVERIDKLRGKIMANQAQDHDWYFKNLDPPPQPSFLIGQDPQHFQYHYVRYCMGNNPSSDVWIDVELIDKFKIKVAHEQYQEYIFYLKHPEIDQGTALGSAIPDPYSPTFASCNLDLPLVAEGQAPWRFDPFQNPVNVNWSPPTEHYHFFWQLILVAQDLQPQDNAFSPYQWLAFASTHYQFTLPNFQPCTIIGEAVIHWDTFFTGPGFTPYTFLGGPGCPTPLTWDIIAGVEGIAAAFSQAVADWAAGGSIGPPPSRPCQIVTMIGAPPFPLPPCYH